MGRPSIKHWLCLVVVVAIATMGCGSGGGEPEGYKSTDFEKKPVPAGFGPKDSGAPSGPPEAANK